MLTRILTLLMIIISFPIDLSYGSPRIRDKVATKRVDNVNYKLSENVFPEHYTLKMSPHFNNSTFTGYIKILIHVKEPTDNITLHQKDLNITKEKIYLTTKTDLVINIKDAGTSGTKEQEFYTITFTEILNEDTYYLHIPEFYGNPRDLKEGFYFAHYTDEKDELRRFAMTFFESLGARLAFPCFDEPSFRAKFKIYIIRPPSYHSVSNTKLIKSIELNNSLYEDEFEDTFSMPTYLVAFIISEMKLTTSPDRNNFRIIAPPEMLAEGYEKPSLKLSVKILQTLETYLNINYTLNKMDQAVIPDEFFTFDGMENWGCIMYKESYFLITPFTITKEILPINLIIAHEFVHQWFGNLVTMKWWRYLWLKEGFAQFLQSKILDILKPEWKVMERFVAMEKQTILELDSLESRDLNQDAGTRKEISNLYDYISYHKAGSVIHMVETIMTPNIFRRGLTNYLQDRAFQSAVPIDLYRNLQKSLDDSVIKLPQNLNIEKIMSTWDSQKGYPLVYVQRDYNKNQEVVKLTQSLYTELEEISSKPSNWYIPINYASKRNPNFNDTRFSNWLLKPNETITISNLRRDDWLILNKQEAYYYRVNYDEENWELIAKALEENYSNVHVLNRAQIIDDSFHLAKLEKIDVSIPLQICSYLHQEDYYIIHSVFLRNIAYIEKYIRGTNVEQKFQNYVTKSLKRSYDRLGNNPIATDTQIDKLHRAEVVNWMCTFNYGKCRANTWMSFDEWRKNDKPLDVDSSDEIMCNAIRYGSEDDWNYIYETYESADDDDFQNILLGFLACSENITILEHFIHSSINSSNKYSITDVVMLISFRGFIGVNASMHYVAEHFNVLTSKFGDEYTEQLLNLIFSQFTTEAHLDQFIKLLPKNVTENVTLNMLFNQSRLEISLKEKRVEQISRFFYDPDKIRSDGNVCRIIPIIYSFILYGLIIIFT